MNFYNVIFYGSYEQCINFEEIFKEWNVVGYIVNEDDNIDKEKILSANEINSYNYDFIMVLDESNENKILKELKNYES